MRFLTYRTKRSNGFGCLVGDEVLDLNLAFNDHLGGSYSDRAGPFTYDMLSFLETGEKGFEEALKAKSETEKLLEEGESSALREKSALISCKDIRLDAPITRPRKNIVCLGFNYAEHLAEGNRSRNIDRPLPEHPIFFTKPPTAVAGPYDDVVYPRATEKLDYEVELALVIGRAGKYIPKNEVYDHIAGYMVFNDISARDLQRQHAQWFKGKSCDTFAPMGPHLVTPDEVGDPQDLDLWLKVNGVTRQSSNTREMIFDVKRIVSVLSAGMTLEVGDIIATGTPSGVGSSHALGLLKVGDVVETSIEKIGTLRNTIVSEK